MKDADMPLPMFSQANHTPDGPSAETPTHWEN